MIAIRDHTIMVKVEILRITKRPETSNTINYDTIDTNQLETDNLQTLGKVNLTVVSDQNIKETMVEVISE